MNQKIGTVCKVAYAAGVVITAPFALYGNRNESKWDMKYGYPLQLAMTWPITWFLLLTKNS